MENAIEVKNLTKRYGDFTAVDSVSFSVAEGSMFAFLGPNGAGKSTTINCLTTFLTADGGEAKVLGFDYVMQRDEIRRKIGAVFQESVLDSFLTVKENIRSRAALYGMNKAETDARYEKLKERFSLAEIENKRFGKLSGGQKRRADIARALVNSPKILFLDEPTTGLDPQTRLSVWENIKLLREEENVTVFLTTHYMEEAERADYVVMIDGGRVIAEDTPENLINRYSSSKLRVKPKDSAVFADMPHEEKNGLFIINVKDCFAAMELAEKHRDRIEFFEIVQGNMDDVFIALTGSKLRGD